jgi:ribokinase
MRGAKVLVTQLEIPDEAIRHAVELGQRHNLRVILNPAPARPVDRAILEYVDIITPNEGEARTLAGIAPDDTSVTVMEIGQRLLGLGVGRSSSHAARKAACIQRNAPPVEIPAYPVAIDTVGAGDALAGWL